MDVSEEILIDEHTNMPYARPGVGRTVMYRTPDGMDLTALVLCTTELQVPEAASLSGEGSVHLVAFNHDGTTLGASNVEFSSHGKPDSWRWLRPAPFGL